MEQAPMDNLKPEKKSSKRNLIFSAVVLLLLVSAVAGRWYFFEYENWQMAKLAKNVLSGGKYLQEYYEAKKAINDNPNDFAAYAKLGSAKLGLGDLEGAEKAYLKSLSINPQNTNVLNNLANFYFRAKNYPKAEEYYLKIIELEPKNPVIYINLVSLYDSYQEKRGEIEKIALKGLEQIPDDQNLLSLLASYYYQAGKMDEALEIYERILTLRPDDKLLKEEIERLKQ